MSEETSVAPVAVPFLAKLKFLGIGALVGLLFGGVGAGKVWFDMSSSVSEAEAAAATATSAATGKIDSINNEFNIVKGQVRVLKARVSAANALYEFNRQNYGSAADQLKMVRAHLDALDAGVHKLDPDALKAAKAAAKATNIEVAGDLAAQADMLAAMGRSVDALVK